MSAVQRSAFAHQLREAPGHLRAEFGHAGITETATQLREFAVTCIQHKVDRALVVAADEEPAIERALRDAFTTMVLAGITSGFRLALVTTSPRVAWTYRYTERDFNAAGVNTRLFDNEEDAARWLNGRI